MKYNGAAIAVILYSIFYRELYTTPENYPFFAAQSKMANKISKTNTL
jgi:hypothetical protein